MAWLLLPRFLPGAAAALPNLPTCTSSALHTPQTVLVLHPFCVVRWLSGILSNLQQQAAAMSLSFMNGSMPLVHLVS